MTPPNPTRLATSDDTPIRLRANYLEHALQVLPEVSASVDEERTSTVREYSELRVATDLARVPEISQ